MSGVSKHFFKNFLLNTLGYDDFNFNRRYKESSVWLAHGFDISVVSCPINDWSDPLSGT